MDRKPFRTTRAVVNLRQGRNDWYRVTNSAGAKGAPASLHIYDEIGFFGVTAADLIADLAGISGDLDVHLNTPGGEVFDGIAIYNALSQRGGTVRVYVDSLAASIGSVIAMAASPGELIMGRNATMMIHDGFGMALGNAADMREMADVLDKTSDNIASVYADRTGKPASYWRGLMRAETWFNGQEAVDAGLADQVQAGRSGSPVNSWDLSVFRRPAVSDAAGKPYEPVPYRVDPGEDVTCPTCGKMDDRDARFCDQCGRKLPASAFDPAGGQQPYSRKSDETVECPECHRFNDPDAVYCDQCGEHLAGRPDVNESTGGSSGYPYGQAVAAIANASSSDSSPWDAAKAWHDGAESDDPAAFYAGICAGKRTGDKATQAAWALPYRYSPDSAPNADGVRAALARLPSTEGLTNEADARALLERLMKQVNPGHKPEDSTDLSWIDQLDLTAFKEATT